MAPRLPSECYLNIKISPGESHGTSSYEEHQKSNDSSRRFALFSSIQWWKPINLPRLICCFKAFLLKLSSITLNLISSAKFANFLARSLIFARHKNGPCETVEPRQEGFPSRIEQLRFYGFSFRVINFNRQANLTPARGDNETCGAGCFNMCINDAACFLFPAWSPPTHICVPRLHVE